MSHVTLESLIDDESEVTPHDILLARREWGRYVMERVRSHPLNRNTIHRFCLDQKFKDKCNDSVAVNELFQSAVSSVKRSLRKFRLVSDTTEQYRQLGYNSSYSSMLRTESSVDQITNSCIRELSKSFKVEAVSDHGVLKLVDISVGSIWLPVITLTRGDEVQIPWTRDTADIRHNLGIPARPGQGIYDPLTPFFEAIGALRPGYKDDPHCNALEEYDVTVTLFLNVVEVQPQVIIFGLTMTDCITRGSTEKRVPVSYLWGCSTL